MGIRYKTIEPPHHLRNIVKNFFVLEGCSKTYNLYQFADYYSKLFFIKKGLIGHCRSFNLQKTSQSDGRVISVDGGLTLRRQPAALLGPCSEYSLIRIEGEISVAGAELQPAGIWHLMGSSTYDFADKLTPLCDDTLLGIEQLAETVASSKCEEDAFGAISMFIASKGNSPKGDGYYIGKIRQAISACISSTPVAQAAQAAGTSAKQLQRLFRKYIGMPPMRFALIARLKQVLRHLTDWRKQDRFSDIADNEAFYDLSHLCKETKKLTGHSPTVLRDSGFSLNLIDNMAIVHEDDRECTLCIYSY